MKVIKITALAGTAAMALAGILSTTAASAVPAASASRKPVVEAVNHNQGTMSPYQRGRLYLADGPTFWLSLYRFKTRCMMSDQVFHEVGYAAR